MTLPSSTNPDIALAERPNPALEYFETPLEEAEADDYLERLQMSLAQLDSAQAKLQDQDDGVDKTNEAVIAAIQRVRNASQAVHGFSRQLERRLRGTESTSTPTSQSTPASSCESDQQPCAQIDFDDEQSEDSFCFQGKGLLSTLLDFGARILSDPQIFLHHYQNFARELLQIVQGKSELTPDRQDHRFRDAVWHDNVFYRALLQSYLSWSEHLIRLIDDLPFEDRSDRERTRFLANQFTAACAPSNSLLNPAVIKRSFQTGGLSLVAGAKNFVRDLATNNGMPRQISTDAYRVGQDLAMSAGVVVLHTDVLELIQYQNTQTHVYQRPVLIIPPQINKFYIFDLTPKNSVVQHLLNSGHQVFMVSWKNPNAAHRTWNLTTYVTHLYRSLQAITAITGCRDIGLISGCAGGLTATALQAYSQQRLTNSNKGAPRVCSHTLLVTAISAKQHPFLNLFINKNLVSATIARAARRGVMDGRELSHIFAWLRPVDLVWNFWVNNVLLGKEPPTMDVLFWDNDSTRLPAGLQRDFIEIVVNDRFANSDAITIDGYALNLAKITSDFYFVGGEGDYLMPWQDCYRNAELFPNANCRFILSDGGHIQSILRPPGIAKTYYYTNNTIANGHEQWLAGAEKQAGSWWSDWAGWLDQRSGPKRDAPVQLGNAQYPPLGNSPGQYVLEK